MGAFWDKSDVVPTCTSPIHINPTAKFHPCSPIHSHIFIFLILNLVLSASSARPAGHLHRYHTQLASYSECAQEKRHKWDHLWGLARTHYYDAQTISRPSPLLLPCMSPTKESSVWQLHKGTKSWFDAGQVKAYSFQSGSGRCVLIADTTAFSLPRWHALDFKRLSSRGLEFPRVFGGLASSHQTLAICHIQQKKQYPQTYPTDSRNHYKS